MAPRTTPVQAVAAALTALGARVEAPGRPGPDVLLVRPGTAAPAVAVRVRATTSADPVRVAALLGEPRPAGGPLTLLVADRIPDGSRALLRRAGWGWLDRRGDLRVQGPALLIETTVPTERGVTPRLRPGIRGVGGTTWAAAILLEGRQPILREVARQAGLAPSTLAAAARALRDARLEGPGPELFWSLAEAWAPDWVALADPGAGTPAGVASGWEALGAWGAAVPAAEGTRSAPARLYVRDPGELAAAVDRYGEVRGGPPGGGGAVLVAAAPTPLVFGPGPGREGRAVVAPVFAALDVVSEAGGPEFLATWEPPKPWVGWWQPG